MANGYKGVDRDQCWLLLPSMRDWLPKDHLAWFVMDAVSVMDLERLYLRYAVGGVGNSAYDPAMMLGLLIYSYCLGVTSSRKVEAQCRSDVAFRVLTASLFPDHTTICRFRKDNNDLLKHLFTETLRMASEAGILRAGTVALDGTKIKGNASLAANRTREGIEKELARFGEIADRLLAEADRVDAEEDARYGVGRRGDEMPAHLTDPAKRLATLEECKRRVDAEEARLRAEQQAKIDRRAEEERETGKKKRGRKPKSVDEAAAKADEAKANMTDPDSGIMKTRQGHLQGYNAQAVVTMDQIIVAADVTNEANDQKQLVPMLVEAQANVTAVDQTQKIERGLGDAGYCSLKNLTAPELADIELFIATGNEKKASREEKGKPAPRGRIPKSATVVDRMTRKLRTKRGRAIYRQRGMTVEPVFGQIKDGGMRIDRFRRRGRDACRGEWNLISACHNLLKLWRRKCSGACDVLRNRTISMRKTDVRDGKGTVSTLLDPIFVALRSLGAILLGRTGVSPITSGH